jgi:hypothetical protein
VTTLCHAEPMICRRSVTPQTLLAWRPRAGRRMERRLPGHALSFSPHRLTSDIRDADPPESAGSLEPQVCKIFLLARTSCLSDSARLGYVEFVECFAPVSGEFDFWVSMGCLAWLVAARQLACELGA